MNHTRLLRHMFALTHLDFGQLVQRSTTARSFQKKEMKNSFKIITLCVLGWDTNDYVRIPSFCLYTSHIPFYCWICRNSISKHTGLWPIRGIRFVTGACASCLFFSPCEIACYFLLWYFSFAILCYIVYLFLRSIWELVFMKYFLFVW
jgi:hypothetical protein